jgi:cytochrome c biogenesis protein CcmG/thiol:disulfide interchange protein DsbE
VNRKVLAGGLLVSLPLVFLLLRSLGRDPHRVESPLVGRAAPPFSLRPLDAGAPVRLDALRGRTVVLNFWATWCVPCLQEHPVLNAGPGRFGDEVAFLGVVYEDEEDKVRRFLSEHGGSYPSFMDDGAKTAIAYGVYGVPETYFVSPQGTVASKHVGPLSMGQLVERVEHARASARAGKEEQR